MGLFHTTRDNKTHHSSYSKFTTTNITDYLDEKHPKVSPTRFLQQI